MEHNWFSMFVPTNNLTEDGDLVEPLSSSEKMMCKVTRPNPQLVAHFRALIRQNIALASNWPEFEFSPAAQVASAELLKVASSVVGQPQREKPKPEGRTKISREEIIRRCKSLLVVRQDCFDG